MTTRISPLISPEAQDLLKDLLAAGKPPLLDPFDAKGFATDREEAAAFFEAFAGGLAATLDLNRRDIGGTDCLEITGDHVRRDDQVLLHLHGGTYTMLKPETALAYTGHIAKLTGLKIVSPDYRLAPQNPFPAGLTDCVSAYRGLLHKGFAPESIAIFGESAGGGMALAIALSLRGAGLPLPACLGLISPWLDLEGNGESWTHLVDHDPLQRLEGEYDVMGRAYIGQGDPKDPCASPIYADMSGLPPILFQIGGRDILLSDSLIAHRRAKEAGVATALDVWEGMPHVWHIFQNIPEAQTACKELSEFMTRHLKG